MILESRDQRDFRAAVAMSSRALLKAQLRAGQHDISCPVLLGKRLADIAPRRAVRQLEPTLHPMLTKPGVRRVTVAEIKLRVCKRFGLSLIEMESRRQHRSIAHPRQIAMYLARRFTPLSLPEIGRYFGGRDHTTVIHAVQAVTERRRNDPDLDEQIAWIEAELIG